jgi:hypothetical protein
VKVQPVVRYMILCEDWSLDPRNPHRVNLFGLLSNIHSTVEPPYPLVYPELCVFLALTEGRGVGTAQIVCVFEETGQRVFHCPPRKVRFGSDPLEVTALSIRIRHCRFPVPGMYSMQFWYNGDKLKERPLRLR